MMHGQKNIKLYLYRLSVDYTVHILSIVAFHFSPFVEHF